MNDDFKDVLSVFEEDPEGKGKEKPAVERQPRLGGKPLARPTAAAAAVARPVPAPPAPIVKAASPLPTFLLLLVLLLVLVSLLVNAVCLSKLKRLSTEQRFINEAMKEVKLSADRAWKVQCGIFFPVPNQRPQEYQIMYEKRTASCKTQIVTKPID